MSQYIPEKTTAGMSYSYNLPKTYKGTSSSSFPCYKNLDQYGPCKDAAIIAPVPISLIPTIFYNTKPHPMPKKIVPPGQMAYNQNGYQQTKHNMNNLKDCGEDSPYKIMPQTDFSWGGRMDNENHFKKGFNDHSY
jgi:hypothetical protein